MKNTILALTVTLLTLFLLNSCGYHNPYVYTGPDKRLYIASWKNRTSELQLGSEIYQSLLQWYQKSDSFTVVNEKEGADLILGGEIVSIDLPSLSYGANNTTREVKLKLRVRYILKDLETGEILFQEAGELRTEEYVIASDSGTTSANEDEALETIIDEMSQDIYLLTLNNLKSKK